MGRTLRGATQGYPVVTSRTEEGPQIIIEHITVCTKGRRTRSAPPSREVVVAAVAGAGGEAENSQKPGHQNPVTAGHYHAKWS